MQFSRLLLVRQNFPDRSIRAIPSTIRKPLGGAPFASRLKPGARVAIGVGSRGITNISTVVHSVVDYWKSQGMHPFIFPAMGSHGAATAEGQADVLAHYGIIEETMGCPIVSSLEVVPLGKTPEGISTFMDRNAYESDGVMLAGRVKWHTDFAGRIESGLFEMMEQREAELLSLVKSWMGKIPMDLDILILDEIGKNISGAGMDTKVVNRGVHGQYNPWPDAPAIQRIFVRDLSELSYGNGVGWGMADVVSDRLLNKIDWLPTCINSLTASTPAAIRTPAHFPTDRER